MAAPAPRVSVSPRRVAASSSATAAVLPLARSQSAGRGTQDETKSTVSAASASFTPVAASEEKEENDEKETEEESDDLDALFEQSKLQSKRGAVKERALQSKTNQPNIVTEESDVNFDKVGKGRVGKGKTHTTAAAVAKKTEVLEETVKSKGGKSAAASAKKTAEPTAPARRSARPIRG